MIKIYQKPFPDGEIAGFTLIELLVVVLIIGILSAVTVPQYEKAVEKARAAEAVSLVRSLLNSQKIYRLANGQWADAFDKLDVAPSGSAGNAHTGKHFIYRMHMPVDAGSFHIDAQRRNGSYSYEIVGSLVDNASFDSLTCEAAIGNEKANELCASFGPLSDYHMDGRYNYYEIR